MNRKMYKLQYPNWKSLKTYHLTWKTVINTIKPYPMCARKFVFIGIYVYLYICVCVCVCGVCVPKSSELRTSFKNSRRNSSYHFIWLQLCDKTMTSTFIWWVRKPVVSSLFGFLFTSCLMSLMKILNLRTMTTDFFINYHLGYLLFNSREGNTSIY